MARRTSHTHAIRHANGGGVGGHSVSGSTWCNYGITSTLLSNKPDHEDPLAYSRRNADCPACSAAIGKAILRQLDGRVTLEKVEVEQGQYGHYYRTAWLVKIDGEPAAHVVMKNGWGNPWELKELPDPEGKVSYADFGSTLSDIPTRWAKTAPDRVFQTVHGGSKEMMAVAAFRLRERDMLPTITERRKIALDYANRRKAEEEERQITLARNAVERERKHNLREERKELALDWVNAVLAMPDLTNSQRAGAQAALDIINGKDVI